MGGQIARYALAYMEHHNLPHNAGLYLALDSPHNGATIPIGLHNFVDYFARSAGDQELVDGLAQLDSPASRELTQHHVQRGAFAPDPARTTFLSDLATLGNYPSQLRRIAVTNGALDGAPQLDQPKLRSTTQRRGSTTKPFVPGGARTTSTRRPSAAAAVATSGP